VLIDPSYESDEEFGRVADGLARAHRRFATGIYLVWYPIKSRGEADAFCGEVETRLAAPLLRLEIDTARAPDAEKQRLAAAGLLIVNPPYGFAGEMERAASFLAPRLGHDASRAAKITLTSR
jgi:23S rRNA (adenine2030-N6)-methyltransferase